MTSEWIILLNNKQCCGLGRIRSTGFNGRTRSAAPFTSRHLLMSLLNRNFPSLAASSSNSSELWTRAVSKTSVSTLAISGQIAHEFDALEHPLNLPSFSSLLQRPLTRTIPDRTFERKVVRQCYLSGGSSDYLDEGGARKLPQYETGPCSNSFRTPLTGE